METDKIFKYVSVVIGIMLLISIFLNYDYHKKNQKLDNDLEVLNTNYGNLQNSVQLLQDSIKELGCSNIGARSGILSCSKAGWQYCFDSLGDDNAGDKSKDCCESIYGSWHEEKCCASDKVNSNWVGNTGKCSERGEWIYNK